MKKLSLILALSGMFLLSGCWGCKEGTVPEDKMEQSDKMVKDQVSAQEAVETEEAIDFEESMPEVPSEPVK